MLKIRITYDSSRFNEVSDFIEDIRCKGYRVLSQSRPYTGRGKSVYSSVYIDVEKESKGNGEE